MEKRSHPEEDPSRPSFSAGKHQKLWEAALEGNIPFVLSYLKAHEGEEMLDDTFQEPLIHFACYTGQITLVRALIEGGFFTPEVQGRRLGTRPIHSAAAGGHLEIVRYLLSKGATVGPTPHGLTPLHSAAVRDHVAVAKVLLAAGADPKGTFDGRTPIELTQSPRLREILHEKLGDKPLLSFQLMSDLHCEFFESLDGRKQYDYPAAAPYLALLGDIGQLKRKTYEDLLRREAQRYQKVFLILGNHEYYSGNQDHLQILAATRDLCSKIPNVQLLQRESVVINNVRIIGTTLWSFVPPESKKEVARALNDYRLIYNRRADGQLLPITVDDTTAWHTDELAFIEAEIKAARAAQQEIVVFTHHTPYLTGTSAPEHDGSEINCAFSTDLQRLFGNHVQIWAFGHTHYSSDQIVRGTRLVSNQMGYTFSGPAQDFNPKLVIHVYKTY